MPFQQTVFTRQAPAVPGDFASDNPRNFYPGGPNGIVTGNSGLTIGNFAWAQMSYLDWDNGATVMNNFGFGLPSGIVHRQQVGVITTFLADNSMLIPSGMNCSILTAGDIWLKNSGSALAQPGMKAYANLATGAVNFAITGSPTTVATASSGGSLAAGTAATTTGTISGNVLTTGASVTNTIYPGAIVTGTGVASGTWVVAQLTGTTGGAGTYAVSIPEQTVASTALTITPSILTTGTMSVGTAAIGQVITAATNSPSGTVIGMAIQANLTATTWSMSPAPLVAAAGTVSSSTITLESNIETKWYAVSAGAQNELIRCSSQALG